MPSGKPDGIREIKKVMVDANTEKFGSVVCIAKQIVIVLIYRAFTIRQGTYTLVSKEESL